MMNNRYFGFENGQTVKDKLGNKYKVVTKADGFGDAVLMPFDQDHDSRVPKSNLIHWIDTDQYDELKEYPDSTVFCWSCWLSELSGTGIKATKLAKRMYPDAEEEDGWLYV